MITKQQAINLIERFKPFVNPYVGSGMLSNTHDDSAILHQAKKCAIICVNEIIKSLQITTGHCDLRKIDQIEVRNDINFWVDVIEEIGKV